MTATHRTLLRTLGPALLIVAALVGTGLYLALRGSGIEEEYEQRSIQARDRVWTRPANPPGWSLEDGDAAPAYESALDDLHCRTELDAPDFPDALEATRASHTLPSPCEGAICPALEACDAAFDGLLRGSKRRGSRSPIHVWSTWRVDTKTGNLDSLTQLIRIAELAALDARQQRDWRALAGVLRYAQDITRGGSLIGVMIGVATSNTVLAVLVSALQDGEIDADGRAVLVDELRYLDGSEPPLAVLFAGERLVMFSAFLPETALRPPQGMTPGQLGLGQGGLVEGILIKDLAKRQWAMWNAMEQHSGRSYAERRKNYDAIAAKASGSLNPLVRIGTAAYGRYDQRYVLGIAARRLVRFALGDDLAKDPFTEQPFRRRIDGDSVIFESTSLDPALAAQLLEGLDDEQRGKWLRLAVSETRPTSPTAPAASPPE